VILSGQILGKYTKGNGDEMFTVGWRKNGEMEEITCSTSDIETRTLNALLPLSSLIDSFAGCTSAPMPPSLLACHLMHDCVQWKQEQFARDDASFLRARLRNHAKETRSKKKDFEKNKLHLMKQKRQNAKKERKEKKDEDTRKKKHAIHVRKQEKAEAKRQRSEQKELERRHKFDEKERKRREREESQGLVFVPKVYQSRQQMVSGALKFFLSRFISLCVNFYQAVSSTKLKFTSPIFQVEVTVQP
jgi:hypothetical protein